MHLLICSIYVHQDKPQLAMASLDQAVSSNFAVRETPLYHIVNAKVLIASNKMEDARKVGERACVCVCVCVCELRLREVMVEACMCSPAECLSVCGP